MRTPSDRSRHLVARTFVWIAWIVAALLLFWFFWAFFLHIPS
jgi:type VI protein secretion system component VasF